MNFSLRFSASLIVVLLLAGISEAVASYTLPYTTRSKDYSGWTPAPRGEINSIGMAGATVAIPASISAAEYNAAGFGMQTQSLSAQINSITIYDQRLQKNNQGLGSNQIGFGVCPPPWGFSFAYYSTMKEGGDYIFPSGKNLKSEVSMGEYRLTLARSWNHGHFSLGASLKWMFATREIGLIDYNASEIGYQLGALYRLEDRVVVGLSYSPSVTVDPKITTETQTDLPGFNRAVKQPSQLNLGVGWIPNRFFKMGAALQFTGATSNTALLADQSVVTGANSTVTPRLGASYVLAEFQNLKMELALGGYYESSRFAGSPDRVHATMGYEINPWFLNAGFGFDLSKDYRNLIVSVGLDIIRTMRTFDIIPKDPLPPINRFWPSMTERNSEGLAPGLTDGKSTVPSTSLQDVKDIVKNIPSNIQKKVSGKETTVQKKEKAAEAKKVSKKMKKKKLKKEPKL